MKTKLIKLAKKVGFGAVQSNVAYKAYPDLEPTQDTIYGCVSYKNGVGRI